MSQHIFTTTTTDGKILMVTMGYDRPLDFVFCTVVADSNILYSNLDDPAAGTHQQEVEYYRPVLQQFGVDAPESLFKEVQEDQTHRVGNRVVVHTRMRGAPRWMKLQKADRCDRCKRELPARSRVFIIPGTNAVFCGGAQVGDEQDRRGEVIVRMTDERSEWWILAIRVSRRNIGKAAASRLIKLPDRPHGPNTSRGCRKL